MYACTIFTFSVSVRYHITAEELFTRQNKSLALKNQALFGCGTYTLGTSYIQRAVCKNWIRSSQFWPTPLQSTPTAEYLKYNSHVLCLPCDHYLQSHTEKHAQQ